MRPSESPFGKTYPILLLPKALNSQAALKIVHSKGGGPSLWLGRPQQNKAGGVYGGLKQQTPPVAKQAGFVLTIWLREPDLNRRPSGYEPDELPGCSIPRQWGEFYSFHGGCQALLVDSFDFFSRTFSGPKKKATALTVAFSRIWLREPDLNRRPSGYEPDELPGCSIPRL